MLSSNEPCLLNFIVTPFRSMPVKGFPGNTVAPERCPAGRSPFLPAHSSRETKKLSAAKNAVLPFPAGFPPNLCERAARGAAFSPLVFPGRRPGRRHEGRASFPGKSKGGIRRFLPPSIQHIKYSVHFLLIFCLHFPLHCPSTPLRRSAVPHLFFPGKTGKAPAFSGRGLLLQVGERGFFQASSR